MQSTVECGRLTICVAGQTCCATGRSMRKPRPSSGVPRRPQLVRMTPPTQINCPVPGSCNFLMTALMMLTMLRQRVSNVVAIGNPCGTSFFSATPSPWFSCSVGLTDPPRVSLGQGRHNVEEIREGMDIYLDCHVRANPPFHRLVWLHNVSLHLPVHNETMSSSRMLQLRYLRRWL